MSSVIAVNVKEKQIIRMANMLFFYIAKTETYFAHFLNSS